MSENKLSEKVLHDPADATDSSLIAGEAHDELTGHEYDGIQEYDNPLPGWWKWLFIGSILFSLPYWAYYHFGAEGRTIADAHAVASAEADRLLVATMGEIKPDRATLVKFKDNETGISVGMSVFRAQCAQCHGKDGEGIVGPNLTDDHYKNVKDIEDILKVVNNGAAGGAMPPWLNRLGETERILVSAYVAHLRGSQPAGTGKTPEGRVIGPWPTLAEVEAESGEENDSEEAPEAKPEATETAGSEIIQSEVAVN